MIKHSNIVNIKDLNESYLISFININKINILNSYKIESVVKRLFETSEKSVYLNLNGINFIDSTGFNTLLKLQRIAFLNNLKLVICNLSPDVYELVDLLGLHNEFEIMNICPLKMAS